MQENDCQQVAIAYKSEMITWMIKYLTLKQMLYHLSINILKK